MRCVDREVELGDPFRVDEEVELDDLAVSDRPGADRERSSAQEGDDPGRAVDEDTVHREVDTRPQLGLGRDGLGAPDMLREAGAATVDPKDDVWVEDGDERVEVAASGGGEERLDDFPLAVQVGVGDRRAPDATASPACELARRLGRPLEMVAISSKGTANMSCSTKASRSAGVSVSRTTRSARPTESASSVSCSGSLPSTGSRTGRAGRPRAGARARVFGRRAWSTAPGARSS